MVGNKIRSKKRNRTSRDKLSSTKLMAYSYVPYISKDYPHKKFKNGSRNNLGVSRKDINYSRLTLYLAVILILLSFVQAFTMVTLTGMFTSPGTASICMLAAPNITAIPDQTATVGTKFSYVVNCTSHCAETVTFAGTSVGLNSFSINTSNGHINFTPESDETGGHLTVIVCAKDYFDSDTETFTLTVNAAASGPVQINGTRNSDGLSVDLNWTAVSGATNYTVYYAENISQIVNLTLGNIGNNVSYLNVSENNWTDSSAYLVQKRYYTVSSTTSNGEALVNDTAVGKFTFQYDVPVSDTYGKLASNYASVYLDLTLTAENFLQQIPAYLNSTMSVLQKSDGNGEFLKTHVRGLSDGNDFDLNLLEGYLVTADNYHNHTIVGDVSTEPYNVSYTIFVSDSKGKLATSWKGIPDYNKTHTAETLLQEIPSYLNSTASKLMKTNANGEHLKTHVRGLSDGNDFDMELGKGYIFTLDNNHTQTLCTRCFD